MSGVNWRQAIEDYGVTDFGIWMTPDGEFLNIVRGEDHRIISTYVKGGYDHWTDAIADGGVTVHYDPKARFLWIRCISLSSRQRSEWRRCIEGGMKIDCLLVHVYSDDGKPTGEDIELDDTCMIELFLTDTIAFNLARAEQENGNV